MTSILLIPIAILVVIAAILARILHSKILYQGPARAIPNDMPHLSRTTRTVFIVLGEKLPGYEILVAEVSLAQARAIGGSDITGMPVQVVVRQRSFGEPYVASVA